MSRAIASYIETTNVEEIKKTEAISHSEEIQRINKVKYNLSIVYFVGVIALLSTLFI